MNKYKDHVYVISEGDADRQIAVGFIQHPDVNGQPIQVMPVAGGWPHVLRTFRDEYVQKLMGNPQAHVVLLIDFDGCYDQRRAKFDEEIPDEIKSRVFVVGPKSTPESLRNALNKTFEKIGESLAEDCNAGRSGLWGHEQLNHNEPDRRRLNQTVKPFLF